MGPRLAAAGRPGMVLGAGPASPVSGCPGEERAAPRLARGGAGLQAARLPRRGCTVWAEGRAAPGLLQAAPLLTAGRRAGAQDADRGVRARAA